METLFPFGLPFPTIFYTALYVATWLLHAAFMSYVLAGTAYLVADSLLRPAPRERSLGAVLADWMPFGLSAAITAGVAPLLFVQILHQQAFYTANLLLSHRWMAILPALIAGFYLLYLTRAGYAQGWSRYLRAATGAGAFVCFLFTGQSWVENHVLSLEPEQWPRLYGSGSLAFGHPELTPRLLLWLSCAFATMLVMAAWQLRYYGAREARETATLALGALGAALVSGAAYLYVARGSFGAAALSRLAWPYLLLAIAGLVLEARAWWTMRATGELGLRALAGASFGAAVRWFGLAAIREASRFASADLEVILPRHAHAYGAGGFDIFLLFAGIAGLAVAVSVLIVAKGGKTQEYTAAS